MKQNLSPDISVIIPALNEASGIASLIDQLHRQVAVALEIIVVDGGSSDQTIEIASSAGVKVISSAAGRGLQLNAGAKAASCEVLLFLHADTGICDNDLLSKAQEQIKNLWVQHGNKSIAGHFALEFFTATGTKSSAYRFYEAKTELNRVNTTNGDQGFLIAREFFEKLGGFDTSLKFLEDQAIAEKIRIEGSWVTLPGKIATSARRFEQEGLARRMILSAVIMGLYSINYHSFLKAAPGIYREQRGASRLSLSPFFSALHRELFGKDNNRGNFDWLGLGRYVRANAWQLFFLCDLYLLRRKPKDNLPFLKFHDAVFARVTNFAICDGITVVLTLAWFYLTWCYCAVVGLIVGKPRTTS